MGQERGERRERKKREGREEKEEGSKGSERGREGGVRVGYVSQEYVSSEASSLLMRNKWFV